MSRLDKIEDRFNKWMKSGTFSAGGVYEKIINNATVDIEHLLFVIKIAEKALTEISRADDSDLIEHPNEMAGIADKALQQIRGG